MQVPEYPGAPTEEWKATPERHKVERGFIITPISSGKLNFSIVSVRTNSPGFKTNSLSPREISASNFVGGVQRFSTPKNPGPSKAKIFPTRKSKPAPSGFSSSRSLKFSTRFFSFTNRKSSFVPISMISLYTLKNFQNLFNHLIRRRGYNHISQQSFFSVVINQWRGLVFVNFKPLLNCFRIFI